MAPRIAGWREHVHLPELGLDLVAKLDTGARTSAIDAREATLDGAGHAMRFWAPSDRLGSDGTWVEAPYVGTRWVKDSGGHGAMRPVIRTDVLIGGERFSIEASLADRGGMTHRMLLGRSALRGRFVVDPGLAHVFADPVVSLRPFALREV